MKIISKPHFNVSLCSWVEPYLISRHHLKNPKILAELPASQHCGGAQCNSVCELYTGFPRYLKVKHFYESFHKPKWCKSKEIITANLYGKICELSQTPKTISFGFSVTPGHILLADTQKKWR